MIIENIIIIMIIGANSLVQASNPWNKCGLRVLTQWFRVIIIARRAHPRPGMVWVPMQFFLLKGIGKDGDLGLKPGTHP